MIISTVACNANLPKAMLMAKSVKRHMEDAKIVVCLVEERMHPKAADYPYFDKTVLAKDMGFGNFYRHMFKYIQIQAASAVKGMLFGYLLQKYSSEDKFVYLDPDMYVTGSFDELADCLKEGSIVITPHHLEPSEAWDCSREIDLLKDGTFHGGLVAIRRTEEAERFVHWWRHVIASDYKDPYGCMFLDQKWLNFVPSFFDASIFKHPGYNVAFWNLHEKRRQIHLQPDGTYQVNGKPLRCFHFSNFLGLLDGRLRASVPDPNSGIYELKKEYEWKLQKMEQKVKPGQAWSYDFFASGKRILKTTRSRYKQKGKAARKYANPFTASNHAFD